MSHASWKYYVSIARPDHWVKHIFILPGIVAAFMLMPTLPPENRVIWNCLVGFISACLIASANYAINEWLDAETDKNHPEKCSRPAASGLLKARYVYLEYAALAGTGLTLAYSVNTLFFLSACAFFISGISYNVKPLRTKDKVYLDVLSEAINNPIRLIMGWAMVSGHTLPPISLLLAYWMGGAFVMAAKRLSEFRFIVRENGQGSAGAYRRSFKLYSTESLIISCFVYALASTSGLAIFLIKYRTEFILIFPLVILLFSYYLKLGLEPLSVAQKPETLHKDWKLMLIVATLVVATFILAFADLPLLERISRSYFVEIHIE